MTIASKRNKKLEPKWKNIANSMPVRIDGVTYNIVVLCKFNYENYKRLGLQCA